MSISVWDCVKIIVVEDPSTMGNTIPYAGGSALCKSRELQLIKASKHMHIVFCHLSVVDVVKLAIKFLP